MIEIERGSRDGAAPPPSDDARRRRMCEGPVIGTTPVPRRVMLTQMGVDGGIGAGVSAAVPKALERGDAARVAGCGPTARSSSAADHPWIISARADRAFKVAIEETGPHRLRK